MIDPPMAEASSPTEPTANGSDPSGQTTGSRAPGSRGQRGPAHLGLGGAHLARHPHPVDEVLEVLHQGVDLGGDDPGADHLGVRHRGVPVGEQVGDRVVELLVAHALGHQQVAVEGPLGHLGSQLAGVRQEALHTAARPPGGRWARRPATSGRPPGCPRRAARSPTRTSPPACRCPARRRRRPGPRRWTARCAGRTRGSTARTPRPVARSAPRTPARSPAEAAGTGRVAHRGHRRASAPTTTGPRRR